tara:strand:- start:32689 stop:33717 length:1029 start_codon:yes stop_codon:yes gene_type:complete
MNKIHITMNYRLITYILSVLLFIFPIHLVFIFLKNLLYDAGIIKPKSVSAKVISVGNISLGGTGKTPTTIAIANFLEKRGFSVGIVSRGHGRENLSNSFLVHNHSWRECGDEVILLKNNVSSKTHIFVSKDKVYAARKLAEIGCSIILLDDGFQHRRIHRDVDIVLLGPKNHNKKRQLIYPYGSLREPICSLKRSDIIISTKTNLIENKIDVFSDYTLSLDVKEELISKNPIKYVDDLSKCTDIISLCSIGDPASFAKTLKNIGIKVNKELVFPDHWSFSERDIEKINEMSKMEKLKKIVCTEKDYVKLLEFENLLTVDIYAVVLKHDLNQDIKEDILSRLS